MLFWNSKFHDRMWLFYGLLNCRKNYIPVNSMEKVSITWWNSMNFGILFLVFSSLLISATWFLSPSLLSLQFPWNNFYQQGKLIVAKSKEYFSVLVLIDLPPQHLTLWKTPFLLHTLILDFPDIIPPGHCLITPSQSLCKCFFNLDPFRVVAKGDTQDSFFFSFFSMYIISLMTSSMTVTAFSLLKDFLTSPSRLWSLSWAPEL